MYDDNKGKQRLQVGYNNLLGVLNGKERPLVV